MHLVRLSLPMIWGIMAIISFQLIDMFYIAQLPGTHHLEAISFTFPVTMLIFSFTMGFGIATSSVISRLIGEKQSETIKRVVAHSLVFTIIVSLGITAIGIALFDPIFHLMVPPEERGMMMPLIRDYMFPWFLGAVFLCVPLTGNSAMRAAGDTFVPAMIMTVISVVNLILDPIFIFGLFGFPRLELYGAALTTVFSNALAMAISLYYLRFRKNLVEFKYVWEWTELKDSAKRILGIALPIGFVNSIQPIINAFITALLATFGTKAVAAYGIVSRVEAFAFIILMGVAVAMAPIIGQNFGAEKYDRVKETLNKAISFCVLWSLLVAIILGIFAKPVAHLFEQDEEIVHYTMLFFWIVPFSYIFANLIRGWGSAFNAMGKPKRSVIMIVTELVFLMIPAVYIGKYFAGVTGIFVAIAAVNIIAGGIFHIIWSRKIKEECASIPAAA